MCTSHKFSLRQEPDICNKNSQLIVWQPDGKHLGNITKFMGPIWGPPGSCGPHVGPMNLAIRVISKRHGRLYLFVDFMSAIILPVIISVIMMTSSNGNVFFGTGPLWGDFTGHGGFPSQRTSDAELWCFLWSASEQTVEQTIETPVIWDAIVLIMTSP